MIEPVHLTDEQLSRYADRSLDPAALLAADDHLSACEVCRDRLLGARQAARIRDLRANLSGHLDYDQLAAFAEDTAPATVAAHLADCEMCRAEAEDLRRFRLEITTPQPTVIPMPARRRLWRLPLAAAVVLGCSITYWVTHHSPVKAPAIASVPAAAPHAPAEPSLSADEKQVLQLALDGRRLPSSPSLGRLESGHGALLGGASDSNGFAVREPAGTVVLDDRPQFSWNAAPGATAYVVSIFDREFRKVAESPAITSTTWRSEQPLARSSVYNWQVTAHTAEGNLRAPVPPAPEARFQIAPLETAEEIARARRDHAANHVLIAALCARAGALDDASRELDLLAASDPELASTLRQSLPAAWHR